LVQHGFKIEAVRGFSPPLTDLVSGRWPMRWIERAHAFLSRLYPKMFAYNFLYVARRLDDLSAIFERTVRGEQQKASPPPPRMDRGTFSPRGNDLTPFLSRLAEGDKIPHPTPRGV